MEYRVLSLIHKELQLVVNPVIFFNNSELILIDTGYKNQITQIEEELNKNNFSIMDITKIVITHHDHDHIGSLKAIKEKNNGLKILSSKIESEYISGTKLPLRLLQAEERNKTLTGKEKEFGIMFCNYLKTIENCEVDNFVDDNEKIAEDLKVIFTNGHSPGHISILLENHNVLFAGDALMTENNRFIDQSDQLVYDREKYIESIKRIKERNVNKVICYHGGIVDKDINKRIEEILCN